MFFVRFFQTETGAEPVREWIRSLPPDDRQAIGDDLRLVQIGFPVGMPLCRPLGDGLFELRSRLPSNRIARLMFFQVDDRLIVVGGFIKKTQTTPQNELELARKRKRDHERNALKSR